MEEESAYSSSSIEIVPITKSTTSNTPVKVQDNSQASANISTNAQQASVDASYDTTINVQPLHGGTNLYGIKNYEIIYKKKKFQIKSNNINKALLYLVNSLNINHDCLFEVKTNKKKNDIYHFKNNKRKIINKIN
jgi:hypothetical protein